MMRSGVQFSLAAPALSSCKSRKSLKNLSKPNLTLSHLLRVKTSLVKHSRMNLRKPMNLTYQYKRNKMSNISLTQIQKITIGHIHTLQKSQSRYHRTSRQYYSYMALGTARGAGKVIISIIFLMRVMKLGQWI